MLEETLSPVVLVGGMGGISLLGTLLLNPSAIMDTHEARRSPMLAAWALAGVLCLCYQMWKGNKYGPLIDALPVLRKFDPSTEKFEGEISKWGEDELALWDAGIRQSMQLAMIDLTAGPYILAWMLEVSESSQFWSFFLWGPVLAGALSLTEILMLDYAIHNYTMHQTATLAAPVGSFCACLRSAIYAFSVSLTVTGSFLRYVYLAITEALAIGPDYE